MEKSVPKQGKQQKKTLQTGVSKGSVLERTGGTKTFKGETVTVVCPDHLLLADHLLTKSSGTASTGSPVKTVRRKSRDFSASCVHCDFPVIVYGRLSPCEHAYCWECARSNSSCYVCNERIQRIQSFKMEGIFICGHKRCFKSFLKKSDLESHIHESHADLLQPTKEKQDNKSDMLKVINPSLSHADAKHSIPADSSTGPAPPRTCFSPSANSQPHDLRKKSPSKEPNEHPPPKPPMSPPLSPRPENCQSEEPSLSLFFHQPCTKAQRSPCPPFQYPPFQRPPSPPPPPPPAEETEPDCNDDELALLEMALKDTPELTFGIPPDSSDEICFCESYLRPSYMGLAGDYGRVRGLLPIQPPNMPPMDGKALEPLHCGSTLDNKDGKAVLAPEPRSLRGQKLWIR